MNEERIISLENRIADLKARWPIHSVPFEMFEELEDLEEALEKERNTRAAAESAG